MEESSERADRISDFVSNIPCINIFSLPMCIVCSEGSVSRPPVCVCVCVCMCVCVCVCVCVWRGSWWVGGSPGLTYSFISIQP